ncbi:MAG TPA: NfeD family protein [Alphaproteobacteria bacterium]|nr:NfeD family protein [Alphaproteobacteria bacterium]
MTAFLGSLASWHWFVLAAVLLGLEVFAPGAVFLWIGVSAAVVGLLTALFPIGWEIQIALWSVLSVAAIVGWHFYRRARPMSPTDEPVLNRRGTGYLGRRFTLDAPIVNGFGKIKVDDTTWKIACDRDLPAGASVIVTAVENTLLRVDAVSPVP